MLDPAIFVKEYQQLFQRTVSADVVKNLQTLVSLLDMDVFMTDKRWCSYALATVLLECGPKFETALEVGTLSYFAKYASGTPLGRALGNTEVGDGVKFRGRGYVQITGRSNYAKFAHLLNVDLIEDPSYAMNVHIAYKILSMGMTQGLFTGFSLKHFINRAMCDYVNARRIINGTDKADVIAEYAIKMNDCWVAATADLLSGPSFVVT